MTEQTLYRIEELSTDGWNLIDSQHVNMTKEETKKVLEQLIENGYNPHSLRAVPNPKK